MITDKIFKKLKSKKRGWVFCAKDFHDLGTRNTIDKTLSRMADDKATDDGNKIIRVVRGIYSNFFIDLGCRRRFGILSKKIL